MSDEVVPRRIAISSEAQYEREMGTLGGHKPFALSVTDGGTQFVECALIMEHEAGLK